MFELPELWSEVDRHAELSLGRAVASEDLLGALLAIDGAPMVECDAARAWLDGAAERVQARLGAPAAKTLERALAALTAVLVAGEGLTGDAEDYYAPDNSRLTAVIARGKGQPILVSSVWVLVGRRAGLDVVGLGLPGHFVVGLMGAVIDAYQGGVTLTPEQCLTIAARAMPGRPFDPAWLAPATVGSIAQRVLRNLANAHRHRAGEGAGARGSTSEYRAMRLLAGLAPDDGPVQIELARLTEEHGAWPEALVLYRRTAERFAGRREGQIAELKAVELESKTRVLN